jgi:L-asparagine oxygenase
MSTKRKMKTKIRTNREQDRQYNDRLSDELKLTFDEQRTMRDLITYIESKKQPNPYEVPHEFIDLCYQLFWRLPVRVQQWTFDLRIGKRDAMLIRHIPVPSDIGPTPTESRDYHPRKSYLQEVIAGVIAVGIGDFICYKRERSGKIFQQIYATKKGENLYSGESSKKELLVHTDNAHTKHPPDWVILMGLREDPRKEALTSYVRVKDVYKELKNEHKIELFKDKFQAELLQSFGGDGKKKLRKPMSILSGSPEEPDIKFNPLMNGMNKTAREALNAIIDEANKIKKPIHLESGDLLVVSNKTIMHDRSVFQPEYSGNDRYLIRCYLKKDISSIRSDLIGKGPIVDSSSDLK